MRIAVGLSTLIALLAGASAAAAVAASGGAHRSAQRLGLPVAAIESALEAKGSVSNGVLSVGIDREDIKNVRLAGTPIKPAFEINGDLSFQPTGGGHALFNGDIPVRSGEVNRVVDAILANGLTFQAEHQHFYDFSPIVWFIHFRGEGDAVRLAAAVHSVLKATSTPLPQKPPAKPRTPFQVARLKSILHAFDAQVGADGVVTLFVSRRNPITIGGVRVKPQTNIATNVSFEPLNAAGTLAAAAPDFAMQANEIDAVVRTMRAQAWDIGCLYNQETLEFPQLFFSHQFKVGDPVTLAQEIRRGLDQTNAH